jgi:hypothetical protein
MAYSTAKFMLHSGGLSNDGFNTWLLDTEDAIATVNTSNYVSDGVSLGAKQGDEVIVRTRASMPSGAVTAMNYCFVIDVGTGTDGLGIDLTDGTENDNTDSD